MYHKNLNQHKYHYQQNKLKIYIQQKEELLKNATELMKSTLVQLHCSE